MTSQSLLAWNGPVKSESGVMVKSCHVLPNSAAIGERLATYSVPRSLKENMPWPCRGCALNAMAGSGLSSELMWRSSTLPCSVVEVLDRSEAAITRPW